MKIPFLLGRAIFGGYFLWNGINHLVKRNQMKSYVESKHVPMADAAVAISGIALIFGGTSILLGLKPKYGAATVAGFLATVSPIMHDYWNASSEKQMTEWTNFFKNMALLGGTLSFFGMEEPWPVSVPVGQPGAMDKAKRAVKQLAA